MILYRSILRKITSINFLGVFLAAALMLPSLAFGESEPVDSATVGEIHMVVGELSTLRAYAVTRVSVTDPGVVDIVEAQGDQLLLVAKSVGQTTLFIWDDQGKRSIEISVADQSLNFVQKRLSTLFKATNITEITSEINREEGRVVLTGQIPSYKEEEFNKIVDPFGDQVINLVKGEEMEDLIQIDVQITELNTTLSKTLGISWTDAFTFKETLPTFSGSLEDLFKIGDLSRSTQLVAIVNALVEEGKAKILSKPKLVVLSGEEARFLVGGEIPIRTTTTTNQSVQSNVEFKEYGITMNITPTIKKGKVDVILDIEVSDIDASNAVGDDVAFTTRNASTRLFLDDKQTIVLAGFIKHNRATTVKKVPFLGSIPVVGVLFRKTSTPTPDLDQELVISLTPTILIPEVPAQEQQTALAPIPVAEVETVEEAVPATVTEEGTPVVAEAEQEQVESEEFLASASPASISSANYEGIPTNMVDYVKSIQQKISRSIVYPVEAEEQGLEGTVKLGMLILNDGTLAFAMVKESSGVDIIDQYALNTAKSSAPYDSFPTDTDLKELNITIPIVYNLSR